MTPAACLRAVNFLVLAASLLSAQPASRNGSRPAAGGCFGQTRVIGYSQVGSPRGGWYVVGGIFESIVGDNGWELLWSGGAGVDRWRDPEYAGWSRPLVSPRSEGDPPDRVLLSVSGPYGSDEMAWAEAITETIQRIRERFPSAGQIVLQPVVGGPGGKPCPAPQAASGVQVRASWQHAHIAKAIQTVVKRHATDPVQIVAGYSPQVRSCGDYADALGHLTPEAAQAAARSIGKHYALQDAECAQKGRTSQARPLRIGNAEPNILEAAVRGPQFHAPRSFDSFEQFANRRIQRLREEYRLDDIVKGETDEVGKLLKLRHWVHTRWPIDNDQRFSGDAFEILEKAKTGAGFHCSHSMRVQHAVLTAMGFVARDLGVDSDHLAFGRSNHHGVNEVWSNQYAKWVLLDAKYDVHYERADLPLSALELDEAARADGGKAIVKVHGPDRRSVPMKGLEYPTSSVLGYWWVSYNTGLRTFTGQSEGSGLVVFDNAPFRDTTWFRGTADGLREHWAYRAKSFIPIRDQHQINWTPGVPDLEVQQISRAELDVRFLSVTPNLETYRIRINGGSWQHADGNRLRWKLNRGKNMLDVHTRNRFGVDGPIVTAVVTVE